MARTIHIAYALYIPNTYGVWEHRRVVQELAEGQVVSPEFLEAFEKEEAKQILKARGYSRPHNEGKYWARVVVQSWQEFDR